MPKNTSILLGDYFDNFIDQMQPIDDILENIHGDKGAGIVEETDSKRDLLKAEIRELIDYAIK